MILGWGFKQDMAGLLIKGLTCVTLGTELRQRGSRACNMDGPPTLREVGSHILSLFSLPVFQRSSRAAVVIPASLPTAGGKAPGSATVTHSSLSASLPLSWWGRRQSRAKRITSGQLRSQAVCVSEWGEGLFGVFTKRQGAPFSS